MYAKKMSAVSIQNFVAFVKYLQILICHHLPQLTAIAKSQKFYPAIFFANVFKGQL